MPVQLSTSRDGLTTSTSPFRERMRWLQNHPRFARLVTDLQSATQSFFIKSWDFYYRQSPLRRVLVLFATTVCLALGVVFIIFHNKVFELLLWFANSWRGLKTGPLIMFALITLISFPPLIGYSALSSLCGMMYGFWGWPLLAISTLIGSLLSFLACRYLFKDYAQRLARSNEKFAALTRTMEQDGFTLLWMIRLCPLPYSLSNGALASIPSVTALNFVLATLVTSPKLFMHIFIGDRIARLGTEKDTASKIIDIVSVLVAITIGTVTAYTIYIRTIERAENLDSIMYTDLELGREDDDDDNNIDDAAELSDDFDINMEDDGFDLDDNDEQAGK